MSNPGVSPPDFTTTVGQFRLLANDVYNVPLSPTAAGQGDYTLFSDAEIDGYLALQGNVYRAVGLAYLSLANAAALEAESIKDYDLAIDRRQKAEQLRLQANTFFAQADTADMEGDEGFLIVDTGKQYEWPPELGPVPITRWPWPTGYIV